MSIITISRGSYSHGRDVAKKLAEKLGYQCISREILLRASEHFNIPEIKLLRAVHDPPSILERLTYGKERYVAYIRETLMQYFEMDNVVYHGLAGHLFVQGISHALKVRIIADLDDRIMEEMRREGVSAEKAHNTLIKDDEARRKWSHYLYGLDSADPNLYDMILYIKSITLDYAVEIIANTVGLPCFQPTPESRKAMHTLFLAARVQRGLMSDMPSAKVDVDEGEIVVTTPGSWSDGKQMIAKVDEVIDSTKEVVGVRVRLTRR